MRAVRTARTADEKIWYPEEDHLGLKMMHDPDQSLCGGTGCVGWGRSMFAPRQGERERGERSGLISFVSLDRKGNLARNGRLSLIIDDHGDRRARHRISRKACVDIGGNKNDGTTTTSDQTGARTCIYVVHYSGLCSGAQRQDGLAEPPMLAPLRTIIYLFHRSDPGP